MGYYEQKEQHIMQIKAKGDAKKLVLVIIKIHSIIRIKYKIYKVIIWKNY